MNQPEPSSKASPIRRRCHRSTWLCLALLLSVLLLLNIPGQIVFGPDIFADGKYGPHFDTLPHCEHGWPFAYLRRDSVMLDRPPYWRLSHWNVFEGVDRFSASLLIADTLLCFAGVLVAGVLFEAWRRRRKRLLQFYVCELLVFAGIVAACTAAYVSRRSEQRHEKDILHRIDKTEDQTGHGHWDIGQRVDRQPGGPTWMRQLIGDRPFQLFDRVVGIETPGGEEIQHVVKLPNLKVVRIPGAISNRQLKMLEDLPRLEALDMCYAMLDNEGNEIVDEQGYVVQQYFRLPRLPNLRGLNLYGTAFRGDGLENIPSIQVLDLTDTDIDDESVSALAALARLKKVRLYGTKVSDSRINQLRQALPNCNILR